MFSNKDKITVQHLTDVTIKLQSTLFNFLAKDPNAEQYNLRHLEITYFSIFIIFNVFFAKRAESIQDELFWDYIGNTIGISLRSCREEITSQSALAEFMRRMDEYASALEKDERAGVPLGQTQYVNLSIAAIVNMTGDELQALYSGLLAETLNQVIPQIATETEKL